MGISLLREYVAPYLSTAPCIVEAGAHLGRDSLKMARLWPQATIHCFEPVTYLYQQLLMNTKQFPTIHCYPYALGSTAQSAIMYVSSGRSTATSSLLKPYEYQQEFPDTLFSTQQVEVICIDQWAIAKEISTIDFMWLDIQGSELDALKGAYNILKTTKVLHIEIALSYRYENNPLYEHVAYWLSLLNFSPLITKLIKPTWGNTVFINNSLCIKSVY